MRKKWLMIFLPSILFASLVHAESIYYVQSLHANIRSEPSFGAKVIAKAEKGQKLSSLSKQGNWIKIQIEGKEGYISSLLVSTQPPLQKQTVIKAEDEDIKPVARRRASTHTSAAAARGLTDEERKRDGIEEGPDYRAVDKMESLKVTPEEVTRFKEANQ